MIVLFFSVFYFKDSIVSMDGPYTNIPISAAVGAEFFLIGFRCEGYILSSFALPLGPVSLVFLGSISNL